MEYNFKEEFVKNSGHFRQRFLIKKLGVTKKRFEFSLRYMKDDGLVMGPFIEKKSQVLFNLADTYNILVSFNPNKPKKAIVQQFLQEVMFG